MTIALTHILTESTPEDNIRQLSLLLRALPDSEVLQSVIVIGKRPTVLMVPQGIPLRQVGRRLGLQGFVPSDLQRVLTRQESDIVFAWGSAAATAASVSALAGLPIVMTISDPADTFNAGQWWQRYGGGGRRIDCVCSSETIQRRLIDTGIPATSIVLIRPGFDLSELRRAKETINRTDLGLPQTGRVLLTASPPSRAGGQFFAVWAAAIVHQIWPDACLVIPGISREQNRLRRLIEQIYCPQIYFPVDNQYSPTELLSISDALIFPALADVPTSWLAWAQASEVPIAGCAVPAVTELVHDGHTGFLCQPGDPHLLAIATRRAIESGEITRQCIQNARQQTERLFGLDRYLTEHLNVLNSLAVPAAAR